MTNFWTWASIIGLSATPNLVLGPSVAVGVGIKAQLSPWILLPVVATVAWCEGFIIGWLAGQSTRLGPLHRWVARLRTPRSEAFARSWGVWGGLSLGCALLGQEPILVALRWLGVDLRRIALPLALSNAVFALIYYAIFSSGIQLLGL